MLHEVPLSQAYRVTPTGLYLISTAWQDKRNVQFAFRALGISDDPPLLVIGIQDKNFSREMIQKSGEFVLNVCSRDQLHAVDGAAEEARAETTELLHRICGVETNCGLALPICPKSKPRP